jgi:delta14-sterol reductase
VVWTFISDNYIPLFTSNLIISFVLAIYVYAASFTVDYGVNNRELAPGGHSGNIIYDWFIGRELNPRIKFPLIPEIDIKMFMELRPGLLGWIVIDLAMIAKQYRNYGYITDSILIITGSQAFYVLDGLYMEPAIMTTIDCITDGFGFMLAFGDLAWLPFTYALQTRYLAVYPVSLGPWMALTFGVLGVGYYIFRASNNEKNKFRTDPNDPSISHLKYMTTSQGNKLLISGWWGTARHINYLGDWVMSWAYCLPTGLAGYQIVRHAVLPLTIPEDGKSMINQDKLTVVFQGGAKGWGMIVTYFFLIYFGTLLMHREGRDEEKCRDKYGKDWEAYCKKVPSKIIPYVY